MKTSVYLKRGLVGITLGWVWFVSAAHAEMARGTRRFLRKPHGQWRTSKLFGNDGSTSPVAIRHARSRLSQRMRHGSH